MNHVTDTTAQPKPRRSPRPKASNQQEVESNSTMTRKDYVKARRLLRDNGRYALRWLPADQAVVMERLMFSNTRDPLAERAFVQEYDRKATLARAAG